MNNSVDLSKNSPLYRQYVAPNPLDRAKARAGMAAVPAKLFAKTQGAGNAARQMTQGNQPWNGGGNSLTAPQGPSWNPMTKGGGTGGWGLGGATSNSNSVGGGGDDSGYSWGKFFTDLTLASLGPVGLGVAVLNRTGVLDPLKDKFDEGTSAIGRLFSGEGSSDINQSLLSDSVGGESTTSDLGGGSATYSDEAGFESL